MEEEAKNKDLERITNEMSRNISNTPVNQKLMEIFNRGGGTLKPGGEAFLNIGEPYIENEKKCFRLYDSYKNALSKKEIEIITGILKTEGYEVK